ncbi:hypothetical protein WL29_20495 [Burkholderia ubonensis]|uniref:Uncharacterized protein n=1 Tax=Burkholderia ubonensis TaxID=101571 RepID=A0A119HFD7_9BURK|nr:hypothetical protein [Burkholderia ubonensis]KWA83747.1 hypothetical protein WL29_20495 [Burkholderia ubonensis]
MAPRNRKYAREVEELLTDFLSNLTDELFLEMALIAEGAAQLDKVAVKRFGRALAAHGLDIYKEFEMMTRCGVHVPSFMRFLEPGDADGMWQVDDVRCATPAFGFNNLDAVTAELWALSASAGQPAVSALFLPVPTTGLTPFLLFSVFSDEAGNFAVNFGLKEGFRWSSIQSQPIVRKLEQLLNLNQGLDVRFFDEAAERLLAALANRPADTVGDYQKAFVTEWLKQEMRPVGTLEPLAAQRIAESIRQAMTQILDETTSAKDAQHGKQVKALRSQLEKADLLSKGSQNRAARLEAELKTLRRQAGQAQVVATTRSHQSIGQALDLLFE